MGFLDNLDEQRKREKVGQDEVVTLRSRGLAAVTELLDEVKSCFGSDPKGHGIEFKSVLFPVTGDGVPYHAEGLKIFFDPRRFIQIQPKGLVAGGYRVDIGFHGCIENHSHTLLLVGQEGNGEERVWAFFRKDKSGRPELRRWSGEAFEEILNRQVLGRSPAV